MMEPATRITNPQIMYDVCPGRSFKRVINRPTASASALVCSSLRFSAFIGLVPVSSPSPRMAMRGLRRKGDAMILEQAPAQVNAEAGPYIVVERILIRYQ